MNHGLLETLEDSIMTTDKLLALIEADREDMGRCIHGDILQEYQQNSDEIFEMVRSIKNNLIVLQNRQKSDM